MQTMRGGTRSVLVVGGAGYIGSHAAKELQKQGYETIILDDLTTGHKAAAQFGTFYEGSFGNRSFVEQILKKHQIQAVMHFGAKAVVPESVSNPLLYYTSNVAYTIELLNAMQQSGVKDFIFSSTCATFGEPKVIPIGEATPQAPVNPYGQSKLMIEMILKDLSKLQGFRYGILRYFNAAGADSDGKLGEDHCPETHLIPNAVRTILGQQDSLCVYGNDYPTKDGSCIRDYIHVTDLASAHIRVMEEMQKTNSSYDFNLGSEKGYSVFEVIAAVEKVTGKKLPLQMHHRRPGDPPVLIADSSKARKFLGWDPQYDLEEIVRTAYEWMKNNPRGYAK